MRVLLDVQHPAEVNFFMPLAAALRRRGAEVLITAHLKYGVADLLNARGVDYVPLSRPLPSVAGLAAVTALRTARMIAVAQQFRPDVLVARLGAATGATGKVLGVPSISFDENEYHSQQLLLQRLLSDVICTGLGYELSLGRKQRHFPALPQYMYTAPERFRPDPEVLRRHGLEPNEPYFVLRLSAWEALHDMNCSGLAEEHLLRIVQMLKGRARVVVSAESRIPESLEEWANPLPPEQVLHLLAGAHMYIGEGGSMAAEAACLGTPAIFISPLQCGYINVLKARYGLVRQTTDPDEVQRIVLKSFSNGLLEEAETGHKSLMQDSEDPLPFVLDLVEQVAERRGAVGLCN